MRYRAIITDVDGTAIDSPKQKIASPRLNAAIAKLRELGIKVSAATGRPLSFARPAIDSIGLEGPVIISGGAQIVDAASGKKFWERSLSVEQMKQIREKLSDKPYKFLWNNFSEDDYLGGGWGLDSLSSDEGVYFFEVIFVTVEQAGEVEKLLSDIDGITVINAGAQRPGLRDVHITSSQANKEEAVHAVEEMLGVKPSEMIGIGDGENDLHLFEAVGYKVAMGNANDKLKSAADEVIGDVNDDGLAEYFEKLIKDFDETAEAASARKVPEEIGIKAGAGKNEQE